MTRRYFKIFLVTHRNSYRSFRVTWIFIITHSLHDQLNDGRVFCLFAIRIDGAPESKQAVLIEFVVQFMSSLGMKNPFNKTLHI